MKHLISVEPLGDGWAVKSSASTNELVFKGGRAAEASARDMAKTFAIAGHSSEILIRLRDGAIAARIGVSGLDEPAPRRGDEHG